MADNVALPLTGSGASTATVLTDDCTTGHAQIIKLAYSADGVATLLTADADGLLVNLGTNNDVVATNAGTFAVQVDGAALTALQLIDNIVHVEDSAHSSGHSGAMALAVRRDADTTLAGTTGDYAPLQVDANGYLKVEIFDGGGSHTVDNAGTFAVQVDGAALTALQLIDNPVATISSTDVMRVAIFDASDTQITSFGGGTQYAVDAALGATPTGTLAVAIRDDALSSLTPVEGDAIGLRVDANGALWVIPSGTVTVDGSGVTQPISAASLPLPANAATEASLVALLNPIHVEDTAHNTGDSGITALVVRRDADTTLVGTDGDYAPLQVNSSGALKTASTVFGNVAHDAADSGNPVGLGAQARSTNPTAVADADRVSLIADDVGRQVVVCSGVRDLVATAVAQTTNTSETTILAAGGAGVFHDLTNLAITNETATATVVTIRDDTAAGTAYKFALAANGGIVLHFNPPLPAGAANDNWTATSSATVTLDYFVQAVKNI